MEDTNKIMNDSGEQDKQNGCDCEGKCCPPKKKNNTAKFIFTIILVAAIGVIAFKLVNKPAPAAVKETCCPQKFSAGYDTTKKATCDTTKGSSCCPK